MGTVLLQTGVSICSDGHGGVRVELGCDRNDRGECEIVCGPADEPGSDHNSPAHPCDDEPWKAGRTHLHGVARQVDSPAILFPVFVGFEDLRPEASPARPRGVLAAQGRPPDAAARLRTIILIV